MAVTFKIVTRVDGLDKPGPGMFTASQRWGRTHTKDVHVPAPLQRQRQRRHRQRACHTRQRQLC